MGMAKRKWGWASNAPKDWPLPLEAGGLGKAGDSYLSCSGLASGPMSSRSPLSPLWSPGVSGWTVGGRRLPESCSHFRDGEAGLTA